MSREAVRRCGEFRPRLALAFGSALLLLAIGCNRGDARSEGTSASRAKVESPVLSNSTDPPAGGACSEDNAACSKTSKVVLGDPIRGTQTVPLRDIAITPPRYAQKTVRTEGTVTAVCQAAGCWMEITDEQSQAHIRMHGHRFFVPKTAAGRRAVVEGVVLATPDNGECEQEAKEATGRVVKVELDATGIELL